MTDPVRDFAAAAAAFCAWCTGSSGDPEDELRTAQRHLARLYALALELPAEESADLADPKEHGVRCDDARWKAVYRRFAVLPFGYYAEVLEPQQLVEPQTALGDVGDDLADVFRDLDEGLGLFRAGLVEAAAWHWAFHFRIHWGRHAVAALWAMRAWAERETD